MLVFSYLKWLEGSKHVKSPDLNQQYLIHSLLPGLSSLAQNYQAHTTEPNPNITSRGSQTPEQCYGNAYKTVWERWKESVSKASLCQVFTNIWTNQTLTSNLLDMTQRRSWMDWSQNNTLDKRETHRKTSPEEIPTVWKPFLGSSTQAYNPILTALEQEVKKQRYI